MWVMAGGYGKHHHHQQQQQRHDHHRLPACPFAHNANQPNKQATDVESGIYNLSPVFALSSERRRRKLYGPVMWA